MSNPKVSVIIPVFNADKFLKKCLDSVFNQSYSNFEVIIVNDGSTDNSNKIIDEYQKKYKNIILINQNNQGSSYARKKGLMNISKDSEYFAFCDADDSIHKNYLKIMVEKAKETNADIVQCNYYNCIGFLKYRSFFPNCLKESNIYNKYEIMNKLYISYFGITNFPGYLHTKLYKRKFANIIVDLPIVVNFMADDLSVNIRLIPFCDCIVTIPDRLYFYKSCVGGTSKFMPTFMNDYLSYHKIQLEQIEKYHLNNDFLYYSQIEIINVLHSWLLMNLNYKKTNKDEFVLELTNWINKKEIDSALNNINLFHKWNDSFYKSLKLKNFNMAYDILYHENKKNKLRKIIKIIVMKLSSII